MAKRPFIPLFALLLFCGLAVQSQAQSLPIGPCSAFAPDGTLATAWIKDGDLHLKIAAPDQTVLHEEVQQLPGALNKVCELAFNSDSHSLGVVVHESQLTVLIFDRTGHLQSRFSSPWFRRGDNPIEPDYRSPFLSGFLQDNSLVIWRYAPVEGPDIHDASHIRLHRQRWSVKGELLSDQDLGDLGSGAAGRQPISFTGLDHLWLPMGCEVDCYRNVQYSGTGLQELGLIKLPADYPAEPAALPGKQQALFVYGDEGQKAELRDLSGKIQAQVGLPAPSNFLRPLVPDWNRARRPVISSDGEIAAVARHHVAWVMVDTDRDWGSDIVVLKLHPLKVIARVKTGKGELGAVAVDHRNGFVRLAGFWHGKWQDLKCKEDDAAECKFKE